jgi:outer membrane protein assembly factor BamB
MFVSKSKLSDIHTTKWKFKIDKSHQPDSQIITAQGIVIFSTNLNKLYALNIKTGKPIWSINIKYQIAKFKKNQLFRNITCSKDKLYVYCRNAILVIDIYTGEILNYLLQSDNSNNIEYHTQFGDKKNLLVNYSNPHYYLDSQTKKLIKNTSIIQISIEKQNIKTVIDNVNKTKSMTIRDNKIYWAGIKGIFEFDKNRITQLSPFKYFHSTQPDKNHIIFFNQKKNKNYISKYSISKKLWLWNTEVYEKNNICIPVCNESFVIFTTPSKRLYCIDNITGRLLWIKQFPSLNFENPCIPLLDNENIYIFLNNQLNLISARNGADIKKTKLPTNFIHKIQPLIEEKNLLFFTKEDDEIFISCLIF